MKILVVAGASGGHIFPASSFICALQDKQEGIEPLLVLASRSIKAGIVLDKFKVKYISISGISRSMDIRNLIALGKFLKGTWESLKIIVEFKPDMVVGFGGLDSIPGLFFAWLFRIKTLIHEQNVLPGRANSLLAKFVDRVAISFSETKNYLNINPGKIVVTGNPLRRQLKQLDQSRALDFFGLDKDKLTLLVMGGSQGSEHLNTEFLRAAALFKDVSKLQVIHLAGAGSYAAVKQAYSKIRITAKVFGFFRDMEQAYSAADLVISRSGATTVAELIFFGKPAIIFPYPYAYSHQLENARILKEKGCAMVINDAEPDKDLFRQTLESFINNPAKIAAMRSGFKDLARPDAASLLAEAALSLH
ncbi:MAG: undecaprenyldiphospho-muramoylpentapeptide beta-N-acetylglucosaminyltransferase [Candidatus Omnitrophota bacterium]|jgi:UDP-N-acetylglucosamine--N-acetylmuramyl-(pentapeptide) pyrophosphoryl-undecaprenol N-acetylglucosamine transferase